MLGESELDESSCDGVDKSELDWLTFNEVSGNRSTSEIDEDPSAVDNRDRSTLEVDEDPSTFDEEDDRSTIEIEDRSAFEREDREGELTFNEGRSAF